MAKSYNNPSNDGYAQEEIEHELEEADKQVGVEPVCAVGQNSSAGRFAEQQRMTLGVDVQYDIFIVCEENSRNDTDESTRKCFGSLALRRQIDSGLKNPWKIASYQKPGEDFSARDG